MAVEKRQLFSQNITACISRLLYFVNRIGFEAMILPILIGMYYPTECINASIYFLLFCFLIWRSLFLAPVNSEKDSL